MTIVRDAKNEDWIYIDSLRKREGQALGFIPKDAYLGILNNLPYDGRKRYLYSRILVTEDNGDLTGYAYISYAKDMANVFQICVQEDARRWNRALLMINLIEQDALKYNKHGIKCRVAYDLESNFFWRAIGFKPIKLVISTWLNQRESKSKRPLWIYKKSFNLPLYEELT